MSAGRRLRTKKPVAYADVLDIDEACDLLRQARNLLRGAGAIRARGYAARALKSAIGAHNHASAMWRHWGNDGKRGPEPYLQRAMTPTRRK